MKNNKIYFAIERTISILFTLMLFSACTEEDDPWLEKKQTALMGDDPFDVIAMGWLIVEGKPEWKTLWHPNEVGIAMGNERTVITKLAIPSFSLRVIGRLEEGVSLTAVVEAIGFPDAGSDLSYLDAGYFATKYNLEDFTCYPWCVDPPPCVTSNPNIPNDIFPVKRRSFPLRFSRDGIAYLNIPLTFEDENGHQYFGPEMNWLSIVKEGNGKAIIERIIY